MAPRYAGIIMGIANTAGTVAGCITPSVTGYFTNGSVCFVLINILSKFSVFYNWLFHKRKRMFCFN